MNTKKRLFEIIGKIDPSFHTETIPEKLIKRIPFLSEYNIFDNTPDRFKAQRIVYNDNVVFKIDDTMAKFDQYNVSSDITFYKHQIHDNIFYNFIIKNQFHITKPNNIDELMFRVYLAASKMMGEKMSYSKEIMLKENELFSNDLLSKIINDMNGKLFEIEDYTTKFNINLF